MTDRKDKIKNITIIFLLVMLILTFFSNTIMNYSLVEVSTQQVTSGQITSKVRGSGSVEASESYSVTNRGDKEDCNGQREKGCGSSNRRFTVYLRGYRQ